MKSNIDILSPTVHLPWALGIVNKLEWSGVVWNTTKYDYPQDRPFNATIFPTNDDGPYRNLIAHFTVSGTSGTAGILLPSHTDPGNYSLQFTYYVPSNGSFGDNQVMFGGVKNLTIVANATGIAEYQGSTTPLLNAGGHVVELEDDMALPSIGSSVALMTFAVVSAMSCILLLPAVI